ncbi:ROK family protein [Kitasatospora cineracea]|uniref:NBD/HSP70 family sugar kinase n=1 Tax=Kitasatospora cineracea TaxID=88074 RepID=A0A3N4R8S6_9ACTN|nr:ROK family protein [Kitasatospora cineracea]RPE29592.1 putative NBD/HSP70 family sugar kinase [Kitasatospora cineracea]
MNGTVRSAAAPRAGDDRREANAATVLRAVLDHGPVARSGVSRLTGLSPAAVSRQVVDLLRLELLSERPELAVAAPGVRGRPQLPLDVDDRRLAVAGLHVGLPYSTFALLDLRGRVLFRQELPNGGRRGPAVLKALLEQVPRLLAAATSGSAAAPGSAVTSGSTAAAGSAAGRRVLGLGAVTGGAVDAERGVTVRHEPLGWREVPLRELLERATGLPVRVDNHARALAAAEVLFGDPAARRSMVQLFVGHVVDASISVAGTVHQGPPSVTGDGGHLPVPGSTARCHCGRRGCLSVAASDDTLFAAAVAQGVIARPDRQLLLAAVRSGDARADALVRERAAVVGGALALLADVVNPDLLVLTETFAVADPVYLDVVREEFALRSHLHRDASLLVAQRFGADALAVAACAPVLGELYARPLPGF